VRGWLPDGEPVAGGRRLESECAAQCRCLRIGQRVDEVERRTEQQVEPGERKVLFRLRAGRAQHADAFQTLERIVEQCRLADARLAGDREGATAADPRSGEQLVHDPLLGLSSDEHVVESRNRLQHRLRA
jgi:hypothetical protein